MTAPLSKHVALTSPTSNRIGLSQKRAARHHYDQVYHDIRRYKQLAGQKKLSGSGTDDGGTPRNLTPEELAKMAEEEPFRALAKFNEDDEELQSDLVPEEQETGKGAQRDQAEVIPVADAGIPDESHLSDEQKVDRLNVLYAHNVGAAQLFLGVWVLVNVFRNDLDAARSKNPKKNKSFNKICSSKRLHPDLQGVQLRRYVAAAITERELREAGIAEPLEYSILRELAKLATLQDRIRVAQTVIAQNLTARETVQLVADEIKKAKEAKTSSTSRLSELTLKVIKALDEPLELIKDDNLMALLTDEEMLRVELNFRDQARIYSKMERMRDDLLDKKSRIEKSLEPVQQSINILEQLMNNIADSTENSAGAA